KIDAMAGIDVGANTIQCSAAPGDAQAIALAAQPARPSLVAVVVESAQQLAAAQRQRIGVAAFTQRRFEIGYIGLGVEAKCTAPRFDASRPRRELQPKHDLAEVRVRELAFLLGPEHRREFRAPDPRSPEREEHEQLTAPLDRQ